MEKKLERKLKRTMKKLTAIAIILAMVVTAAISGQTAPLTSFADDAGITLSVPLGTTLETLLAENTQVFPETLGALLKVYEDVAVIGEPAQIEDASLMIDMLVVFVEEPATLSDTDLDDESNDEINGGDETNDGTGGASDDGAGDENNNGSGENSTPDGENNSNSGGESNNEASSAPGGESNNGANNGSGESNNSGGSESSSTTTNNNSSESNNSGGTPGDTSFKTDDATSKPLLGQALNLLQSVFAAPVYGASDPVALAGTPITWASSDYNGGKVGTYEITATIDHPDYDFERGTAPIVKVAVVVPASVANLAELQAVLDAINTSGSGVNEATILLAGAIESFTIGTGQNYEFAAPGKNITLTVNAERRHFRVNASGTLTMKDGITLTRAGGYTGQGGGVYAYGTFIMNGGAISNNAWDVGGGVFAISSNGKFTMNDGTIGNNKSGGGVAMLDGSTFTMNDGIITGNEGSSANVGGGVTVLNNGTFNMHGGKITGNRSTGSIGGGGILNGFETGCGFTNIYGGEISGNTAQGNGGGILIGINPAMPLTHSNGNAGRVKVEAGATFANNHSDSGAYMVKNTDPLYTSSYVANIKVADGAWTNGMKYGYNNYDIGLDVDYSGLTDIFEEVETSESIPTSVTNLEELKEALETVNASDVAGPIEIQLDGAIGGFTIPATGANAAFEIAAPGKDVTLTVNAARRHFDVRGTLNMGDGITLSRASGYSGKGGGVDVRGAGTFTMSGGEISNNLWDTDGGAIFVESGSASVTITGGRIADNTSNGLGGAIFANHLGINGITDIINTLEKVNIKPTNPGDVVFSGNKGKFHTASNGKVLMLKGNANVPTHNLLSIYTKTIKDMDGHWTDGLLYGYNSNDIFANYPAAVIDGQFGAPDTLEPEPETTVPATAPQNFKLEQTGARQVTVSWDAPLEGSPATYTSIRKRTTQTTEDWNLNNDLTKDSRSFTYNAPVDVELEYYVVAADIRNLQQANNAIGGPLSTEIKTATVELWPQPEFRITNPGELEVRFETYRLETTGGASGTTVNNTTYPVRTTFTSSDENIARVDDYGNVRAVAPGRVTITATKIGNNDNGYRTATAEVELRIVAGVTAITSIKPLEADILDQTHFVGAELIDFNLPEKVIGLDASGNEIEVPVEWDTTSFVPNKEGIYTFRAILTEPNGYVIAGVTRPEITVRVTAGVTTITSIKPIDADILNQTHFVGAKLSDFNLPEKVIGLDASGKEIEIPVTWISNPAYDANVTRTYTFRPAPLRAPDGYEFVDTDVTRPITSTSIKVTLEADNTLPELPGQPGNVKATSDKDGNVKVTWDRPTDGGAVESYEIAIINIINGDSQTHIVGGAMNAITISGLEDGTYIVRIHAKNAEGDGPDSGNVEVVGADNTGGDDDKAGGDDDKAGGDDDKTGGDDDKTGGNDDSKKDEERGSRSGERSGNNRSGIGNGGIGSGAQAGDGTNTGSGLGRIINDIIDRITGGNSGNNGSGNGSAAGNSNGADGNSGTATNTATGNNGINSNGIVGSNSGITGNDGSNGNGTGTGGNGNNSGLGGILGAAGNSGGILGISGSGSILGTVGASIGSGGILGTGDYDYIDEDELTIINTAAVPLAGPQPALALEDGSTGRNPGAFAAAGMFIICGALSLSFLFFLLWKRRKDEDEEEESAATVAQF